MNRCALMVPHPQLFKLLNLKHMNNYFFYVCVRIEVRSELTDLAAIVAEFEQNSLYNFDSTENIEVLDTEYIKTDLIHPDA